LAAFISEDKITEIKNRADILDIVSESVILQKAGRDYKGLCPFHSEKTPSFTVRPEIQRFHCFGCHENGDVFSFLMKLEGLTFPEAARKLAGRYGIDIPSQSLTPAQKQQMSEKERLLAINQMTGEFYRNCLMQNTAGSPARDYLAERGLAKDTCQRFEIGFAPDGWEHLVRFFMRKRIPLPLAEKSGLIVARKPKQGFYDRFRNRIIFPIHDAGGRVIGFGGRVMDDKLPKYLNSPESIVYNKSKSLYGLHLAKQACRESETVYIVEGYLDLIKLHQAGIQNTVATLGTALTEEHIRLLRGYARKAMLVFDSDNAGIRAAHRGVALFMRFEMDAKVMVLPRGHDPDTFITEYGYEEFLRYADNAAGMMRFLLDAAVDQYGLSIEGKIRILKEMQQPLAAIRDDVARSLYARDLAERIGVDESAVIEKIRSAPAAGGGRRAMRSGPASESRRVAAGGSLQAKGDRLERQLIVMMLQFPEIIPEIGRSNLMAHFENSTLRSIGETIIAHPKETVSEIIDAMKSREEQSRASELALGGGDPIDDNWDRDSCYKLLLQYKRRLSEKYLKQIRKQIKSAEESRNYALVTELQEKMQALQKQMNYGGGSGRHEGHGLILNQFETQQLQVTQSQ